MSEFLNTVTAQIRCKKARQPVRGELEQHILAQAQDYERGGMEQADALEKAVQGMGDPVAIGVEMDRIHRPRMSFGILILAGVVSLVGIGLQIAFRTAAGGREMQMEDLLSYYARTQMVYTGLGYLLMLAVCRVDYSFLGKWPKRISAVFLVSMYIAALLFGHTYGAQRILSLGGVRVSLSVLMWLYVPMFAALLYAYRGEGRLVPGKLLLWALPALYFLSHVVFSLSSAVLLLLVMAVLFSVAVGKGWYHVNKRLVLGTLWAMLLGAPIVLAAIVNVLFQAGAISTSYRFARFRGFLSGTAGYQSDVAKDILQGSALIGGREGNLSRMLEGLVSFNSDYSLTGLVAAYGILAGILVVLLLLWLAVRVLHISFGQKNQLGMVIGCGCGMFLLAQTVWSVLMNLSLIPATSTMLPFVSVGGTGIMVTYILLGLALSVCRYQNILGEHTGERGSAEAAERKAVFQVRFGKGVLTYERK